MTEVRARPWGLAIDFGTTATAAVTVIGEHVSLLSLDGAGRMPSSVYATGTDGALLVGKQADNQAAYALDRYEETPKRLIQKPSVRLGDRQFKPVELITAIMAHVLSEALGQHNNSAPAWLVLTHPVGWSLSQRQVLADAVRAAAHELEVSLPDPVFVAEPVAAAQWYASGTQHDPPEVGQMFAVYDLGGGTFDVAILRRTEHGYAEINCGSLDPLGGYDFDYRLFTYLGNKYIAKEDAYLWHALQRPETGDVDMAERRRQMRSNVQDLKERLSRKPSIETRLRGVAQPVLVTRDDLETLIVADVDRTIDELLTTLDECGLAPSDLAVIYRVGGASRIPLVGQKLEALGAPVYSEDDPKLVVAKGAALTPEVRFEVPPALPQPEPEPEPEAPSSPGPGLDIVAEKTSEAKAATQKASENEPAPAETQSDGSALSRWAWGAVVTGAALLAFVVASAVEWLPGIGFLLDGILVIAVIGVLLGRKGTTGMARARRGFILIAVTSFVASVAGPFAARLFDAGLGLLAIVGILLVAIPQWRRVPSRGAVAGLVVGGLIVAAAGVMSVFAEDRNYGHPRWSVSDAGVVVIAVVLIVCGVLAGRRRKRLIAGGRQELSPATEAPPMSHSPTARTPSLPEVGISALLVLPTLPMYYFLPTAPLYVRNAAGESLVYNAHWSSSLWAGIAICVYLTTVVGLRARSNTRRVAAVVVAIVATAAFWVFRVAERNFIEFTPVADLEPRAHQLFLQTYAAMILFVAAWGIARRRHPLWVVGLLASMGLVGLAMMYYYGQLANPGWLSFWAIDVGVFVASCLACWVFDGIGGRSRHRARTPDRANGAATT